jgi:hypothetical protein
MNNDMHDNDYARQQERIQQAHLRQQQQQLANLENQQSLAKQASIQCFMMGEQRAMMRRRGK